MGTLVGVACFSDAPPVDTAAGSGSTSTGPGDTCLPGSTQACLCTGGAQGVQTCTADGTSLSECDCTQDPTDGPGPTSGADTTAGTTDPGTSTTTGDSAEVGSDGETEASTGSDGPSAYGPCPRGDADCTGQGETCLTTGGKAPETVCIAPCASSEECPPAPPGTSALPTCIDIDQNGRGECVLSCRGAGVCTVGMVCFMESKPPICLWPD